MAFNYLPFGRRVYLEVIAGTPITIPRESFSSGMGRRVFLSDLALDFLQENPANSYDYDMSLSRMDNNYKCFMRMGVFGKPYMTEEFYPVALFNNNQINGTGVWVLPKPYTIFPGERLKARVLYSPGGAIAPLPEDPYLEVLATWPSIAFHGVRQMDKRPTILYDSFPSTFNVDGGFVNPALGTPTILQGEKLQCPVETPVDIHMVKDSMADFLLNIPNQLVTTQIFSPDGRKWWDNDNWPAMLSPSHMLFDLNKPEWVLDPSETIQIEFMNMAAWPMGSRTRVMVTLRGQAEVEI